ncbi:hypothetical protein SAMN02910398_02719 [Butyrivibrio sp. YAB3001]|nr:hypothetical protein SAMN02910398_02719 [Butyrivibrio sp. YAB3001]
MYLKIKTDYQSVLTWLLIGILIIDTRAFYLVPLSGGDVQKSRMVLISLAVILLFFFSFKNSFVKELVTYRFVKIYLLLTVIVITFLSVYSMMKYNENVLDMVYVAVPYLAMFLVPLFLFLFEKNNIEKIIGWLTIAGIISTLLAFSIAVCRECLGISILPGSPFFGFRDGRVRISITQLGMDSLLFLFYSIVIEKKRTLLNIFTFLIMIYAVLFYQSTRIIDIALVGAMFSILFLYRGSNNEKIIIKCIIIILLIIFLFNYTVIINSFSVDGDKAGSTLARLGAIDYFYELFSENPILGIGFIRPKNDELLAIWSGPLNIYFFGDLGLIGGVFQCGLLGIPLFILPLIRLLYVSLRLLKDNWEIGIFSLSISIYYILLQPTICCINNSNCIVFSLVWAILEYYYKMVRCDGTHRQCNK